MNEDYIKMYYIHNKGVSSFTEGLLSHSVKCYSRQGIELSLLY